jgi:hypothetical protein
MQGPAWISLLRRIPSSQHDCLILMTTGNAQIVVQRLIRLEPDFLVGIGRMAGSTDQGKMLIIPYDQLTYLSFNKKLADEEIEAVIGPAGDVARAEPSESQAAEAETGALPGLEGMQAKEPENPSPVVQKAVTAEAPSYAKTMAPAPAKPNPKAAMPSKSILLARLRQRLADDAGKHAKPK